MKPTSRLDTLELAQLALANQIDLVCDAFEEAWARGESPQIEDYLDQCDAPAQESLLTELLLVDREFRVKRGEDVSRQSYQKRFPNYSMLIDGLEFATIDDRGRAGRSTIRERAVPISGGQIAHFELLAELGSGASGTVWKARDTRLQRVVAVKIPRQERLSDLERDQFFREGRASAQLRHPNIVTVFEVGEDRQRVFIVAEFVDGMDLREWLIQRRPSAREAAELAAQLAEALHHAHEQGVIHRDLKPANVLIDRDGRPHITDFGLAKWTADSTGMTIEGNILGTPAYMSPEQARGNAFQVDRRTDVYGLGVLLYEMLTGQPPFSGDIAAIVHQVIHNEPQPPRKLKPTVPRDLETICCKAMEKEPRRRYPSAQEMAVDLRRYLDGRSISARPVSLAERGWRKFRRKPASVFAMFLAFVAAIGAIALASLASDRQRLQGEKHRLEGDQHVEFATEPSGALIAIVPVDPLTGGPDPAAKVIKPNGVTPLDVYLKPGEYFIEAAIISNGSLSGFAEVNRIVPAPGDLSIAVKQMHWTRDVERDLVILTPIRILPTQEAKRGMIAVHFDSEVKRRYPRISDSLYVDTHQALPGSFADVEGIVVKDITFDRAVARSERLGKRLPTADEIDAVTEQLERSHVPGKNVVNIEGLADDHPEWTSTKFVHATGPSGVLDIVNDLFVLKGFGGSPRLKGYVTSEDERQLLQTRAGPPLPTAFRGVRSGQPRFLKW